MRNIYLYIFLFFGILQAQTVNITDTKFKAKLLAANPSNNIAKDANGNSIKIDQNNDGEIQFSEALSVYEMNISGSLISNVTGLSAFGNLQKLNCSSNQIGSGINQQISGLVNLVEVNCRFNDIGGNFSSVNNLSNLVSLDISHNELSYLTITDLNNLAYLNCSHQTGFHTLNLINLPNLTDLDCSYNNLNSLDVSGLNSLINLNCYSSVNSSSLEFDNLPFLETLNCGSNNSIHSLIIHNLLSLKTLDFESCDALNFLELSNLPSLEVIVGGHNQILQTMDLSPFGNLKTIDFDSNNLSSINVSGLNNLTKLVLNWSNQLTTLDVSNLPYLTELNVSNSLNLSSIELGSTPSLSKINFGQCNVSEIDFSESPNLKTVDLSSNNLSYLDFSTNYNLEFPLDISYNPITYLNIKNGSSFLKLIHIFGLPENAYICIDSDDISEDDLNNLPEGTRVSVYCTDYPGENYNTLTGEMLYDFDNNGNCINDQPLPYLKLHITNGEDEVSLFTNPTGNYNYYTQEGQFILTPQILDISEMFIFQPANAFVNFPIGDSQIEVNNFCILPNGTNPDVEILIYPLDDARPGFRANYKVFYRNKGNQTVSGDIFVDFMGEKLDFISSSIPPVIQSDSTLSFQFENLIPFESREILLEFELNAPTDTPPVNIGDWLSFAAEIEIEDDVYLDDNSFVFRQEVVGSYDPNDILCLEGRSIDPVMIGEELHYRIRFENTGNYPAERVVVAMPINVEEYNISSFQLLHTSHQVQARVMNNTAEFFFENIDLVPNGEGYILFSIKSLESLQIGDSVMSYADIYFDYNYPITTNEELSIFEILGVDELISDPKVQIYPNPVNNLLNIEADDVIMSVDFFDQTGRIILTSSVHKNKTSQSLHKFPKGIYYLKVITTKGTYYHKIIKE